MASKNDIRLLEYEWVKNLYLEAKERNIEFYFHQSGSMFLKDGKNIGKWNLKEQIKPKRFNTNLKEYIDNRALIFSFDLKYRNDKLKLSNSSIVSC